MSLPIIRPPRYEGEVPLWRRALTLFARKGWRDEKASLIQAKQPGSHAVASWTAVPGTVYSAYAFSNTINNALQVAFHIQHDYIPGGKCVAHVHWHSTGAGSVVWVFRYASAKGHGQEEFNLSSPTDAVVTQANLTPSGDGYHMIAEMDLTNTISGLEPDSLVIMNLYRETTNPNDTLNDVAYAHFCDLHYEVDRFATPKRAPDFYNYT